MKKWKILALICVLLITTASPAFGGSPPVIIDPITVDPILTLPLMPLFINEKSVSTIPLYRLYNSSAEIHTYTSLAGEKNDLIADGWTNEGIVAYLSPVKLPGYIGLHRYKVFGSITILSTSPSSMLPWYTHTGIMGYILDDSFTGSVAVHESSRAIEEGEGPWDSDYYYGSHYVSLGPLITFPDIPTGYNLTGNFLDMWESASIVQSVSLGSIPSNLTGGTKRGIGWTTKARGGLVTLMYSSDNGETWYTIAEDLSNASGSGSYLWSVPNITNSKMKIRILWKAEASASATAWDTSPTFSITADPGGIIFIPIDPGISILTIKPAAPTNLSANAGIITKEINLYWTDNSATETGFSIERKTEGGIAFIEIATVDINETEYTDTAIASTVKYTYRVKALGAIMNSGYSNTAEATYTGLIVDPMLPDGFVFPEFPDPPTNVSAAFTDGSQTEVLISWTPPSGDYTGFKVERLSGMGWIELGNTTEDDYDFVDVDLDGLTGEISYRVKTYDGALTSSPSYPVVITLDEEPAEPEPEPEPEPGPDPDIFDGTQSGWAEAEILEAYNNGLTYPGVMYDYGRFITREEFCTIAVKLYEKLTGTTATPGVDPFEDTDNPDILKAYKLGIVNGISATQFAPSNNITRQEMCVMIYRALDAAGFDTSVDPLAAFPFTDYADIASWAINEVKFCYQNSIMNGTSPTTIDPLLNTPREQAIVLIGRTYNSFTSP